MAFKRFAVFNEKDVHTVLSQYGYELFDHSYWQLEEALQEHPETFTWEEHTSTLEDEPFAEAIGFIEINY